MYCLNRRVGILFRENLAKKSYELRYFFIDDGANLFYIANLPRLQKVIRVCKDLSEIKTKLEKSGERSFNLQKYQISAIRSYHSQAVLPFSNRTCFDIRQKQAKDSKGEEKHYQVFGIIDEDTPFLHEEILILTGKKKRQFSRRKSVIEEEKQKQVRVLELFFEKFVAVESSFFMGEENQSQYEGEKDNQVAQGKGKQILVSEGITYSGSFKQGKKNGVGYLVNGNLDTLECEFIDDELAGI